MSQASAGSVPAGRGKLAGQEIRAGLLHPTALSEYQDAPGGVAKAGSKKAIKRS